jgi:hypothetical protein
MNFKKILLAVFVAAFVVVGVVTVIPSASVHRVSFLGYKALCPFAPFSTAISFFFAGIFYSPIRKNTKNTQEVKLKTVFARPRVITAMAIITLIGWMATVGSWVPVITGITPLPSTWEKSYVGMIWGFVTSDLVWSQLFSVIAVVGLWKMKNWGWVYAMMINSIWIYTMTLSLVRAMIWEVSFEILFFTPFIVYAIVASVYLWKTRNDFWKVRLQNWS